MALLAERILAAKGGLNFQVIDNRAYSVADQFELLTVQLYNLLNGKKLRSQTGHSNPGRHSMNS